MTPQKRCMPHADDPVRRKTIKRRGRKVRTVLGGNIGGDLRRIGKKGCFGRAPPE